MCWVQVVFAAFACAGRRHSLSGSLLESLVLLCAFLAMTVAPEGSALSNDTVGDLSELGRYSLEHPEFVKCPICPPTSSKRFQLPLGLTRHLNVVHSQLVGTDPAWKQALRTARSNGVFDTKVGSASTKRESVNARDSLDQRHPGLVAARDSDLETISLLLAQGWCVTEPTSLDVHGASALDWAAGQGHVDVLAALLPAVLSSGRRTCRQDGRTVLHWAARYGRDSALRWLLALPVRELEQLVGSGGINTLTRDGTTALMLAAYGGYKGFMDILLERGADVSVRNWWGCDVTHWAAMGGHVEVCRWLAEVYRLSFAEENNDGSTPLHKAAINGHADVCRWLCEDKGLTDLELEVIRASHAPEAIDAARQAEEQQVVLEHGALARLALHRGGVRQLQDKMPSVSASKGGFATLAEYLRQYRL